MKSVIYVGIDVHLKSYSLCCFEPTFTSKCKAFGHMRVNPNVKSIEKYLATITERFTGKGDSVRFVCGYEAGFNGFSLYHAMRRAGLTCVLLAPSTIPQPPKSRIKTDRRDAETIAQCLAFGTYNSVYIPTVEDEQVRDYLRMRDDHVLSLKMTKQRILALCVRRDLNFTETKSKWTIKHVQWLRKVEMEERDRETLDEYLTSYDQLTDRIAHCNKRIEEMAADKRYCEGVKKLRCFIGIDTYIALSLLVEIGDFHRFTSAEHFASYLGLVPGEDSSGERVERKGITKGGNTRIRRLLTESAQCLSRGKVGHKSRALVRRQEGNSPKVIAYADRANTRLRRKYYQMTRNGKRHNVAIIAMARELACFIWGMMTDQLEARVAS